MKCKCGSYAINPSRHGRVAGLDLGLCDVCYWHDRCLDAQAQRDKARDETLELAAQMCDEEAKSWVVPSKIMYGRLADKFRAKKGCGK